MNYIIGIIRCIIKVMENGYQNLPEKFLERLQKLYSKKDLEQVLLSMQTKPLPSFRTNTLKTTTKELQEKLISQGYTLEAISWYSDAFILKNKSTRELTETEE